MLNIMVWVHVINVYQFSIFSFSKFKYIGHPSLSCTDRWKLGFIKSDEDQAIIGNSEKVFEILSIWQWEKIFQVPAIPSWFFEKYSVCSNHARFVFILKFSFPCRDRITVSASWMMHTNFIVLKKDNRY